MLGRRIIGGRRYAYAHAHSAVELTAGAIISGSGMAYRRRAL